MLLQPVWNIQGDDLNVEKRYNRIFFSIILLALVLRLVALPIGLRMYDSRGIRFYDEYGGIAQNIADGHGFSYAWGGPLRPTSIHAPLYPYFLAGVFKVMGQGRSAAVGVMLTNIFVSLLMITLLFRFLREIWGEGTALIGMLVVSLYPPQVYYSVSGLPTCMYTAGMFLAVLLTWRTRQEPTVAKGAIWGLVIGLCALSYSFIVILAPLLIVWLVATADRRMRPRAIRAATVGVVVAIIVCVPWTLRNYQVHGRWIVIRDQGGINLWWGNYEQATGGAKTKDGVGLGIIPPEAEEIMRTFDNEVDADRYMGKLAKKAILADPGRTLRLWMDKLGMFWWFAPGNRVKGSGLDPFLPLLKVFKAVFLVLALGGMVSVFSRNKSLFFLVFCVCFAITGLHMVFHAGNIRYFFPLEPILAIPIAFVLSQLLARKWDWLGPRTTEFPD